MTKSLGTLINGEGKDLNLHNILTLVFCTLSDKLPRLAPRPQSLPLALAGDGI